MCNIPVKDDGLVDPKFLLHFAPKYVFEVQEVEVVEGLWSGNHTVAAAPALMGIDLLRDEMRVSTTLENPAASARWEFYDEALMEHPPHRFQMSMKA